MIPLRRYTYIVLFGIALEKLLLGCLVLELRFRAHLMIFKRANKIHVLMNQKVWWVQPLRRYGAVIFCKSKMTFNGKINLF